MTKKKIPGRVTRLEGSVLAQEYLAAIASLTGEDTGEFIVLRQKVCSIMCGSAIVEPSVCEAWGAFVQSLADEYGVGDRIYLPEHRWLETGINLDILISSGVPPERLIAGAMLVFGNLWG